MSEKPLILVTNDDGINAPGIRALISVINEIADVVVFAPFKSLKLNFKSKIVNISS